MKKITKNILIVIACIILYFIWGLFGCVVPATKKDKNWIPYTQGETIFFSSSEGKMDSIYIENIDVVSQRGISGFLRPQTIKVNATRNDLVIDTLHNKRVINQEHFRLIAITTGIPLLEEQRVSIHIKTFWQSYEPSSLESRKVDSIELQAQIFKDVYVLEKLSNVYNDSSNVEKVFWIKEDGLIGYKQYDDVFWMRIQ